MWDKIMRYQTGFSSAVLSVVDGDGFPNSWRVKANPDPTAQLIALEVPEGAEVSAGEASLLFHSHDARLWNLRSFNLKGRLISTRAGWAFVPEKWVPGVGTAGVMGYVRFVIDGHRDTQRFFQKRGQPVPKIDWDRLIRFLMP